MSLLREIQDDLANPSRDVTNVLRKCKILAARLGSEELSRWVDLELNGYPESQPIPEYRRLGANCYANFMNVAWQANRQPVLMEIIPEQFRDSLQNIKYREGIAKILPFVANDATDARINRPDLAVRISGVMYPGMNCWCLAGGLGQRIRAAY